LAERSHSLWEKLTLKTEDYDVLIIGAGPVGTTLALQLRARSPANKVLVVEKGLSAFAMSGHGRLYPLNLPEDFGFPGGPVQPDVRLGRIYPEGVERALLANQEHLDILLHTTVTRVDPDGMVRLSNGVGVTARRIVIATGAGEPNLDVLTARARPFWEAQDRVQDFATFARERVVARHTAVDVARPQTVAVVGGGAAARAAVRTISNHRERFAPATWVHDGETTLAIDFDPARDRVLVRTDQAVHEVDRVVLSLGFKNQTRALAEAILPTAVGGWTDVTSPSDGRPLAKRARAEAPVEIFTMGAAQFWDAPQTSLAQMFADVVEFTAVLVQEPRGSYTGPR
jgi:thioredoxin reductase